MDKESFTYWQVVEVPTELGAHNNGCLTIMILSTNTQITQKFEAGIIDVLEKGVDIALFRCRRNRINF